VRRILREIAESDVSRRAKAFKQLMILAGLRKLAPEVEREARQVPILNDILDHEVLGREYKRGRLEGELRLLRRLIETRFGPIPAWAEERLSGYAIDDLDNLGIRVLAAASLDEVFRPTP
jgi:hypothetical protein